MDLGQDWGVLNRILYPRKKAKGASKSDIVFVAHHSDRVLRVVGDSDELLYSTGTPLPEALAAIGNERKAVGIDIAEMDRALNEALKVEGGIYDQVMALRTELRPNRGKLPEWKEHFIFTAVRSWWGKLLPSSFGVFLHLEGSDTVDTRSLLLIFKRGELVEFDEPDLSSISHERRGDLGEVIKILRERHRVPLQGFAMNGADFDQWSEAGSVSSTWRSLAKSLRQDRVTLIPFRIRVAALIGGRGIVGV